MRRTSLAAVATVAALGFGGVAPATGIAKKTRSAKAKKAAKANPNALLGLCGALNLEEMLEGLTIDLTPIIVVRVPDVCG
jgi:hypothetical protein